MRVPEFGNRALWLVSRVRARRALRYGCELYDSAEALCADPTIDAVYVLTNMEARPPLPPTVPASPLPLPLPLPPAGVCA